MNLPIFGLCQIQKLWTKINLYMFWLYQIRWNFELKSISLYFAYIRFCNHEPTWSSYVLPLLDSRPMNLDESSYNLSLLGSITMKLHVLLNFLTKLDSTMLNSYGLLFFIPFVRFQNHEIIWSHINFLPLSNFNKHELA